jgi:hypothetical protein
MAAVWSTCDKHRVQYLHGTRCPHCPPRRSDGAARADQRRFRADLIAATGGDYRCQYIDQDGVQCPTTEHLQAAHVGQRYADGGGFTTGTMLCSVHHRLVDSPH